MQSRVNGININFQIDGPDSAPWLVLSNSLLTNYSMWDEQVADLKQSYRILRYDQRGHGGTEATEGSYSFDLLVADIMALLDMLGIKRAHFCGLSMGGMTALFLAQRHPQRFDRIIACDCGPASTPASAQQWKERIEVAEKDGMAALVEPTVARWFPPDFVATKAPVLDRIRGMIRSTPLAGFRGCAQALSDYDLRPGLGGIDRRTLLIVGTKDATVAGIKQIKEAVRGSALVEVEGAGHICNVEQPALVTRSIREFLSQA
jgi:3-oxoadipate enol-lactonase